MRGVGIRRVRDLAAHHEHELRAHFPLLDRDLSRRVRVVIGRHRRALRLEPFGLENHHLLADRVPLLVGIDGESWRGDAAGRNDFGDEGIGLGRRRAGAVIGDERAIHDHVARTETEAIERPVCAGGPCPRVGPRDRDRHVGFDEGEALAGAGDFGVMQAQRRDSDVVLGLNGDVDGLVGVAKKEVFRWCSDARAGWSIRKY